MPSFFTSFAIPALALAGSAFANPLKRDDACLAAVTGSAALGDPALRSFHCSSFIKTVVTPAAFTVTTTITDAPGPPGITGKPKFKRDVTVCPNEVPNYASACDLAGYKSACKVFGISSETTYTIPATTTTVTVYAGNGPFGSCTGGTATVTSTITIATGPVGTGVTTYTGNGFTSTVTGPGGLTTFTVGGGLTFSGTGPVTTVTSTVTSTVTASGADSTVTIAGQGTNTTVTTTVTVNAPTVASSGVSAAGPTGAITCVTKERADALIAGFVDLLEYTSYAGSNYTTPPTPAGRGYHYNVSADIFDPNFSDTSDSINWMAGFPLGTVTFPSKAAFDYGQGVLQPEVQAEVLNVWYGCNTVTWRWLITPLTQGKVRGLNHFVLNSAGTQILENYAEFDNAAWLSSYGVACSLS